MSSLALDRVTVPQSHRLAAGETAVAVVRHANDSARVAQGAELLGMARRALELTLPIAAGDLFFFFTDGVSEAMDAEGSCFGEDRLSARLAAHADLTPEEIRDRLVDDVATFVQAQPQHDDITMLILKIE